MGTDSRLGALIPISLGALIAGVSWLAAASRIDLLASRPASFPTFGTILTHALPTARGFLPRVMIDADSAHQYEIHLEQDAYLEVEAEQEGVDLALAVADGRDRFLLTVDSPNGSYGNERLLFVALETGSYRLLIWPLRRGTAGHYRLRVRNLRMATSQDELAIRAERIAAEAEKESQKPWRSASAQAGFQQAADLFHQTGALWQEVMVLRRLSQLELAAGRASEAVSALERALELEPAEPDVQQRAGLENARGQALYRLGRFEEAREAHQRAISVSLGGSFLAEESAAWNNLAAVNQELGNLGEALDAYSRALHGWRHLGEDASQASVLHNLGTVYLELNRFPEARDRFLEALSIKRRNGPKASLGLTLTALGTTYAWQGELDTADALYFEALEMVRRQSDTWIEAAVLDKLGSLRAEQSRFDEAESFHRRSEELFLGLEAASQLAWVRANLGWTQCLAGRRAESEMAYAAAWPTFVALGDRAGQAYVLYGRARNARSAGDFETALEALKTALDHIESLRSEAPLVGYRIAFTASRQSYYEAFIDLLMERHLLNDTQGWASRAFEISERSRARSFLESLGHAKFEAREESRGYLLAEDEALLKQLDGLDRLRLLGGAPEDLEELQRSVIVERTELLARYSTLAALRESPPVLSLSQIQRLLDDDTTLLAFHVGEERSFAWLVGRTRFSAKVLPERRRIEEWARTAHALLSSGRANSVQGSLVLRHLSTEILTLLAEQSLPRRLLVVPDGPLQSLPLAALPVPGSGEPLVRHVDLVTLDSVSVTAALRSSANRHLRPPLELAVIAGPVYSTSEPQPLGQPGTNEQTQQTSSAPSSAPLPPLPWALEEAREILGFVPASRTFAALGFDATREVVLSGRLSQYRVLHFASHAFLHPHHPELSGLALSMVDREGRALDGFLRSHQIHRLNLNADLVVLSACQTGLGEEVAGEGVLGLTRSFAEAGARRLVVSLWSVRDKATSVLMRHFYEGMYRADLPPAAALRRAQQAMLDDPDWRDPRHWAAFVVRGDWQ